MSNVKISQLPPLSASVENTDVIPIVDGGQTKKVTALTLQAYTQGNSVLLTGNQSIDGVKTFIQQLVSSVATGTAPFQVASTTKVTNLNADYLDGYTSADLQLKLNGTGIVKSTSGTISYLTDNSSNWNTAYNDSIVSVSVTGGNTKTLTLTQQDGGTLSAYWDNSNLVTSVFGRIGDVVAESGDYTTSQVTEGTNLYYTQSRFNTAFSEKSTTDLTEGTNLYFTNARARTAISNTATGLTYTTLTGVLSTTAGYGIPTTATQANWDTAYTNRITSAASPLSITSNAISISQANVSTNGYLSATDWNTFNNKQAAGNYITALTGEASASGPGSASVTLLNSAVIGKVLTGLNITGGAVSASDSILSAFGKVQNQINGLVGGVIYKGTWNAETNTPTLTSSVGTQGWYYIVSVPGSTDLNGITDWKDGDWAIYNGSVWQKVDNTDAVISVNGQVGIVNLTTSNISEGTNLYFTQERVSANTDVAANTAARHNAVTLGTASGLSLSGQQLSLGLSSASTTGALSQGDWSVFNAKQAALSGTGIVKSTSGVISYLTDNTGNWDIAYNNSIVSGAVTGTSTKTLTLNQQDGGTITASWSDADTGLTSVGLSMPSAFSVSNSPLTSNGTIAVTGAGTTSQYVRGDGSLATFPTASLESQRLITEVYNETGATLIKGSVVYINGGHGNLPTITKAIATSDATSAQTYGIVQNDITDNNNGFVVVSGSLTDINTNSYAPGTALYLSSTIAGAWTSTKQYAPNHLVYLGVVTRSHPTQGIVEVKIQNGYELDELHNVAAQSPSNGDILQYVSATSLWTKTAGTTSNISEGSNLYYTDARARAAISESVTGLDYNSTTGVLSTTSGYGIPTTAKQTNWDTAYNDSIVSAAVTGTTTKLLTLNQQDGGTITASWSDYDTFPVTSVFGRTGAVVAASGDYTTTQVTEGTNLYYTDARFNTSFAAKSTTFLTEGTNLYYTAARFNSAFSSKTTSDLTEGTNLYYTDGRSRSAISLTTSGTSGAATYNSTTGVLNIPNYADTDTGITSLNGLTALTQTFAVGTSGTDFGISSSTSTHTFNLPTASATNRGALSSADWTTFNNKQNALGYTPEPAITAGTTAQYWRGDKTWQTLNTSVVPEGTNLYYTTGRFDTAFATKTTTNLAEGTNLYYTSARFNSAFSGKTTTDLAEGTNLYYTDARARAAISVTATGLSYSSGVIGLASGYVIPTTTQETNWNSVYTNAVYTTSTYSNPSWLTSLAWSKISGTPTTISGYGITDAITTSNIGSQSVNYANTAGSANSSSTTGSVSITGYGSGSFTYNQTSGTFAGYTGWAGYLVSNHGDGATYYNQTIILPFWGSPKYSRKEGGVQTAVFEFWTSENLISPITAGNIGTYAPTLTGTGASGTWGISITGNANYATTAGSLTSMNISQFTNNSGYITAESDTLASVTARGASTTTAITLNVGNNIISTSTWEKLKLVTTGITAAARQGSDGNGLNFTSNALYNAGWSQDDSTKKSMAYIQHLGNGRHEFRTSPSGGTISWVTGLTIDNLGANFNVALTGTSSSFSSNITANSSVQSQVIGSDGTYGSTYPMYSFTGISNGYHRIFAGTADDMYFASATSRGFQFRPNGGTTSTFVINSGGNVLIGTTTDAGYKLDVNGTARVSGALTVSAGILSNRAAQGNANGISFQTAGTSNWYVGSAAVGSNTDLQFYNHSASAVVLNIANTSGAATFSSSVTASSFSGAGTGLTGTASSLSIGGNAATATNISNNGTVTLATATESNSIYITQPSYTTDTPVKLLNFDWYSDIWQMGNIRTGGASSAGFGIYLSGTEKVRIETDGRISNYAWSTSGRNYSYEWIQFPNYSGLYSPNNGAHFMPNSSNYGPWKIVGTRNGWNGLEFEANTGNISLMIYPGSNQTGFYNTSNGWQFLWNNGELQVSKADFGGGTLYTVLDAANYSSYALPKAGGTLTGGLIGTTATFSGRIITGTGDILGGSASSDTGSLTLRGGYGLTTASASKIEIRGFESGAATQGALMFYTNNTERFRISQTGAAVFFGSVGVTSSYLSVGAYGLTSDTYSAYFRRNDTSTYSAWDISGAKGGYVGAFYNTPNLPHMMFSSTDGNGGLYYQTASRWITYYHYSNNCLSIGGATSSASYRFYVNGDSRIVGTFNVSTLTTNGVVYSNGGNLTNTNPSDIRLKKDIKPLEYGLNEVMALNPVKFKWKDGNDEEQVGLIAQNVQEVMPDLVKNISEDSEFLGLDSYAINIVLINAIKELKAEIELLKNK